MNWVSKENILKKLLVITVSNTNHVHSLNLNKEPLDQYNNLNNNSTTY